MFPVCPSLFLTCFCKCLDSMLCVPCLSPLYYGCLCFSQNEHGLMKHREYLKKTYWWNLTMTLNPNSRPIVDLTRIETFSASHRLHSEFLIPEENQEIFGKCNNPNGHGHNYRWEVCLRGPVDEKTGMVYNLTNLKREMAAVLDLVDHRNIDLDVDYFRWDNSFL